MDQITYNLVSIILTLVGLLITLIGLFAVYIQIKKLREAAWSNTHSKLCDQSFELLRFFSENPDTYDYFYNRKELKDNARDRVFILYATEALVNFLEHLILQRDNLPAKQWDVWERFIHTTLKSSVIVGRFIQDNRDWYSTDLLKVADKCKKYYIDNDV